MRGEGVRQKGDNTVEKSSYRGNYLFSASSK